MEIRATIKRFWHIQARRLSVEGLLTLSATACFFGASNASFFTAQHWKCYSSYIFRPPNLLENCSAEEIFFKTNYLIAATFFTLLIYGIKWFKALAGTDKESTDYTFRKKLWTCELKAFRENINLTHEDRLSLYFYVSKTDSFFKVSRESSNYNLRKKGRTNYKNGIIQQAFQEGEKFQFITADPKAKNGKKSYAKEVMEKSNLSPQEVDKLTMHSRALYGRVVKKLNGEPVGVLLIETLRSNFEHIECRYYEDNEDELTKKIECRPLTKNRLRNIFDRECKRLSHYMDKFEVPSAIFEFEEASING